MSFVLIHLTDIHMTSTASKNYINNKRHQLVDACLSTLCPGDIVCLACSGDIAYSGATDQYLACIEIFDLLRESVFAVCGNDPSFVIVPGNHDCAFGDNAQQEARNSKLDSINKKNPNITAEQIYDLLAPQTEFLGFAKSYDKSSELCIQNTCAIEFASQKILFIKLNTALASRKEEVSGCLVLPLDQLQTYDSDKYALIISIMHHSTSWMHADHAKEINDHLRKSSDLIIVGHDHRNDMYQVMGNNFSNYIAHGKNLQNENPVDSGFSVVKFDDSFIDIRLIEFSYSDQTRIYERISDTTKPFFRNSYIESNMFKLNAKFTDIISDAGNLIRHPAKEKLLLSDIFCWPDLDIDVLDKEKYDTVSMTGNRDTIVEHILENDVTFIVGEKLSGKTSLARMLVSVLYEKGMLPVLCDGDSFTSPIESKIESVIEGSFTDEYSDALIERFRQQNPSKKMLVIDRFDFIGNKEKRERVLGYACQKFKHTVVLTNPDSYMLLGVNMSCPSGKLSSTLRIRMMSNAKRAELINKWYTLLRDNFASETDYDHQITSTITTISSALGRLHGFTPAFPLYVLNMVMVLNSGEELTHGLTKSGYIYDDIIRRSINSIEQTTGDDMSIDMEILGTIAYKMLISQKRSIAFEQFSEIVNKYNTEYTARAESARLIRRMKEGGIIKETSRNTYAFSYPFIFYYFSARYIADRVSEKEIIDQIERMSKLIYVEAYGNILIFICHFTSDKRVINAVILNAKDLFSTDREFDYTNYSKLIDETISEVDKTFKHLDIGRDEDVITNKTRDLEIKDSLGESDGSVDEESTMDMDEDSSDRRMSEISNGIKTIDVLGQIIRNYTGRLNAQAKSEIITEIHSVSMRMLTVWNLAFESFQSEFVKFCIERAEKDFPGKPSERIAKRTKEFLCVVLTAANYSQIHNVSLSLSKETLLPACEETLGKNSGISGKLILLDLQLNCLGRQPVDEAVELYKKLNKEGNVYAAQIVRIIIWHFARRTRLHPYVRDKIRQAFGLESFIPPQSEAIEETTA